MAPKKRINREDILAGAVRVIQKGGPSALSARNLAGELGCSTQPLYSAFQNFEELQEKLLVHIRETYLAVRCSSYKEFGRAFLRFAGEEPALFQFLYLRRREPEERLLEDVNGDVTVELLSRNLEMTPEEAWDMHRRMQYYCYGLGVMIATGYRTMEQEEIDRELTEFYSILLRHYKKITSGEGLRYWLDRSRNLI